MTATFTPAAPSGTRARAYARGRRLSDRIGDALLYALCLGASLLAVVVLAMIAYKVFNGARLSMSRFGFGALPVASGNARWSSA